MILMVGVVVALHPAVKCIQEWRGEFMSARAVSKYTHKLTGSVGAVFLRFLGPDDRRIIMFDSTTTNVGMLRRGAATGIMEQVGDALAAPRVASVAGERSPCWWIEKGVRTKIQVSQVRGAKQEVSKRSFPRRTCPSAPTSGGVIFVGSHALEHNIKILFY